MTRPIVTYFITAVLFTAIDMAYLSTIGAKQFKDTLGDVMAPSIQVAPGVLFYLIFPLGILFFVLMPAMATDRWTTALLNGALFGFFTYATFDLTSFAIIRNWTTSLAAADMAWGTVLTGVVSVLVLFIQRAIFGTPT